MNTFIITGEREGGKTRFLEQLIILLNDKGYSCDGFLSKGEYTRDGCKDFLLFSLEEHITCHLASRKKKDGYIHSGNFYFNPKAIETGNALIKKAISAKTDVIVLDEIGPAELKGQIWSEIFYFLISRKPKTVLVSVRKKIIEEVIDRFSPDNTVIFDIECIKPEDAVNLIITGFS